MLLVIDNYDSFTYNLVDYLKVIVKHKQAVKVVYNDALSINKLLALKPTAVILSPGPGTPKQAGIMLAVIKRVYKFMPILGICLGHQAIAEAFGAKIIAAPQPYHGKVSTIYHDKATIFKNIPQPFLATRYHSLVVEKKSLPAYLEVSAWTSDKTIMGLRVKNSSVPIEGVQFHPEAILTEHGKTLLRNFLKLC